MKQKLFILIFLFYQIGLCKAQKIIGHVLDQYGHGVEEVYILNQRTGNHTHSEHFGQFMMTNVKQGDSLHTRMATGIVMNPANAGMLYLMKDS